MNIATIILILLLVILIFVIFKAIKPYTIKYDTILSLIGGNGSGKTLTGVKRANTMIRKARVAWWFAYRKERRKNRKIKKINKKYEIYNEQAKIFNKTAAKSDKIPLKKYIELIEIPMKPQIYSTIPIYFKCFFWNKREYSCKFKISHALLLEPIAQWSIIVLDELPLFVNQYNWELPEIQNQFAEFATMFRHYFDGHIIITAQASQEIVAQIRRKMNIATWCFNFRKPIWPLSKWFYKMSCCDLMLNDSVSVNASTLVEENTKTFWGRFPRKNTYDSRCYSERINNYYYGLDKNPQRFESLKTNDIIKFDKDIISMLDDKTTEQQKAQVAENFKLPTKKPNMTTDILAEIAAIELKQKAKDVKKKLEEKERIILPQ